MANWLPTKIVGSLQAVQAFIMLLQHYRVAASDGFSIAVDFDEDIPSNILYIERQDGTSGTLTLEEAEIWCQSI